MLLQRCLTTARLLSPPALPQEYTTLANILHLEKWSTIKVRRAKQRDLLNIGLMHHKLTEVIAASDGLKSLLVYSCDETRITRQVGLWRSPGGKWLLVGGAFPPDIQNHPSFEGSKPVPDTWGELLDIVTKWHTTDSLAVNVMVGGITSASEPNFGYRVVLAVRGGARPPCPFPHSSPQLPL